MFISDLREQDLKIANGKNHSPKARPDNENDEDDDTPFVLFDYIHRAAISCNSEWYGSRASLSA